MAISKGRALVYIAGGVSIVGAVASATYFIAPLFFSNKSVKTTPVGFGPDVEKTYSPKLANMLFSENNSGDDAIRKIMFITSADDPSEKRPIDYLIDKLEKRLGPGPEISMVKGIYFSRLNWGDKENGAYSPNTNQIFINTTNIIKTFKNLGAIKYNEFTDQVSIMVDFETFARAVAEYVFQIVYHEFGHHRASIYLNDDYRGNNADQTKVFEKLSERKDDGSIETMRSWDPNFLNKFKETLHYNDSTPVDGNYEAEKYEYKSGQIVAPLNHMINLKDLWDLSNDKSIRNSLLNRLPDPSYDVVQEAADKKGYLVWPMGDQKLTITDTGQKYSSVDNQVSLLRNGRLVLTEKSPISNLLYMYNQDELFTRKFMQATMRLDDDVDSEYGYIPLTQGSSWKESTSFVIPAFLEDYMQYQDNLTQKIKGLTYKPFYDDYLFDASVDKKGQSVIPLGTQNADKIYDAYLEASGVGDDLSVIYYKNDGWAQIESQVIKFGDESNPNKTQQAPTATNEIKFGGYLHEDDINNPQTKYVGYYENNDKKKRFIPIPIYVNEFELKVKSSLGDKVGKDNNTQTNAYWVTKDYVNAKNELIGKILYFAQEDDKGNIIVGNPLKTFREEASTDVDVYDKNTDFQKQTIHPVATSNGIRLEN